LPNPDSHRQELPSFAWRTQDLTPCDPIVPVPIVPGLKESRKRQPPLKLDCSFSAELIFQHQADQENNQE